MNYLKPEEHSFRLLLHSRGLNDIEIAEICNVNTNTICQWRHRYGITANAGPRGKRLVEYKEEVTA